MAEMFILLCEEARQEANNVISLMGVFPPSGIKAVLPLVMPKFAIYAVAPTSVVEGQGDIKLRITGPKRQTIFESSPLNMGKDRGTAVTVVMISPVVFDSHGEYTITIFGQRGLNAQTMLLVSPPS